MSGIPLYMKQSCNQMQYDSMQDQVYKLTITYGMRNYNTALLHIQLCLLLRDINEHYCTLYKSKGQAIKDIKRGKSEDRRREGKRDEGGEDKQDQEK